MSPEDTNNKPDSIPGEVFSPFVLKCLKKIDIQKESAVIDIACGTGRHARLMAGKGYEVIALDLNQDVLIKCKQSAASMHTAGIENGAVSAVHADATKILPFQSGVFDLALVNHFPHKLLFSEVKRVLVKGGYLMYETIGRHGENWRDLPKLGNVRNTVLALGALILYYRDHPAGPAKYGRGSVKILARF